MSVRIVKVEGYISVERRLDPESPWDELHRYPKDCSIEQARILMERIEPIVPTAEHRLMYTRIETTKEVLP